MHVKDGNVAGIDRPASMTRQAGELHSRLRRSDFLNHNVRGDVREFLQPEDFANLRLASRDVWVDDDGHLGGNAHIMCILDDRVDGMIHRMRMCEINDGWDLARFEIPILNGAIQRRFDDICQYARNLKINLRSSVVPRFIFNDAPPDITAVEQVEFERVTMRALALLKAAPKLRSLELDFYTDQKGWASDCTRIPRAEMTSQVIQVLSMLKHAPALCELCINLRANFTSDYDVATLASLQECNTLHTLILEFGVDHGIGPQGLSAIGKLGRSPTLRDLRLGFKDGLKKINYDMSQSNPRKWDDASVECLCNELAKSVALETITIDFNDEVKVSIRMAKAFAALKWAPKLHTLVLCASQNFDLDTRRVFMDLARPRVTRGAVPWTLQIVPILSDGLIHVTEW
jgi:hypothetical protein